MPEPETLAERRPSMFGRLMAGINERRISTTPGPVDNTPTPDEPGHPEYHRRQRAEFALSRWSAAVPYRYRDATASHPDVTAWADRTAKDLRSGGFLVINGTIGTGKTHTAYGALRRIAESGPLRFAMVAITAPDLYGLLRPKGSERGSEHELKQLAQIPLLLLDDLGTEKLSDFTEEAAYRILNARYNECLPMIITTNLLTRATNPGEPDLASHLGDRLTSRLVQTSHIVTLAGNDLRRTHRDAS